MKVVRCRTCLAPMTVKDRARPPEWFCSDACIPVCEVVGCSTAARGTTRRCWVHRPRRPSLPR